MVQSNYAKSEEEKNPSYISVKISSSVFIFVLNTRAVTLTSR
jgi:hypothetical protein